jgi:integrase
MECLSLRVKDLDFAPHTIVVREGKGGKDRVVMLPRALAEPLRVQLQRSHALWEADRLARRPGVIAAKEIGFILKSCQKPLSLALYAIEC